MEIYLCAFFAVLLLFVGIVRFLYECRKRPAHILKNSLDSEAELLAIYQDAGQNLAFFKQQQWYATYYSLLLYGAIVFAADRIENITFIWWAIAAFVIGVFHTCLIVRLHFDQREMRLRMWSTPLIKYRHRLDICLQQDTSWKRDLSYLLVFLIVNAAAFFTSLLVVGDP